MALRELPELRVKVCHRSWNCTTNPPQQQLFPEDHGVPHIQDGKAVSIFGRDRETIQKYFPNGLGEVMANFFKGGGGQFGAAASGRRKVVVPLEFFWFLMNLKAIIK